MVVLKNPFLQAFERVADLKTVHAAAFDLGLTQAAVTKRIRVLESGMGTTLFTRSRRGMFLSEEGKALLQFCKTCHEAEGLLLSKLKGEGRMEIKLKIAGPTSAISSRVTEACIPLYKKYPYLKLSLQTEDHANLISLLRQGTVDLAIVAPEFVPNEMDSKLLKPDRYILVSSADWKGRSLTEILEQERIIDFYENDSTTADYLRQFGLELIQRPDRLFVNDNTSLIKMFMSGVGYGTLTEEVAAPFLERGELIKLNRGQVMEKPLALVWFPRPEKSDYFKDLTRVIK